MSIDDSLPTDLASAHTLIMAQREALVAAQARATAAESEAQYRALLIEKLKYTIRKLRHERLRPILGAWRAARAARASTRRLGRGCVASRNGGADGDCGGDGREDCGAVLRTAPAGAPSAARASAARAYRLSGALSLPVLWGRDIAQDR